jgi:hydroxypyruvate isomerase
MACHPGREAEFAYALVQALPYIEATGCKRVHAMAGLMPAGCEAAACHATYVANLRHAAARLEPLGVQLLIEPINSRDMPGYFLSLQQQAHDVLTEVGAHNLKVQMDLYHCQIMEGDLSRRLQKHVGGVGHIQIAGVPSRHEPDDGEVNFPHLFDLLDALGFDGFVGCEYRPRAGTSEGLGWLRRYQASRATPD